MSGDRTYIGPFGRILPLPEDHDEEPEAVLGPIDETRSSLAMYTLPRPALDFGSDNRGFTDPLRYSSQRNAPSPTRRYAINSVSGDQQRAPNGELLPGVRQLLKPAAQSVSTPTTSAPQRSPQKPSFQSGGQFPASESPTTHDTGQPFSTNNQSPQSPRIPHSLEPSVARDDRAPESLPFAESAAQGFLHNATPAVVPYPVYQGQASRQANPNFYLGHDLPQPSLPGAYSQSPKQLDASSGLIASNQQVFHQSTQVWSSLDDPPHFNISVENEAGPKQPEKSPKNPVKLQPRVVREAVLPGEGPVWVYEDGSTCPKVIDGEPVNAAWGITKAGKPRKRLAIACTTCREKKIKCQPALPKCAQCDKFGRKCHYATAPRTQHILPESPSYEFQARYNPVKMKTECQNYKVLLPLITKASGGDDDHTVKRLKPTPKQQVSAPSPKCVVHNELKKPPSNSQRSSILTIVPEKDRLLKPIKKQTEEVITPTDKTSWEEHLPKVRSFKYDWGANPYDIDPQATTHYVEMFLSHGNPAALQLFPRKAITRWLGGKRDGSRDDMMLIYAMLALGSVFSGRHDCKLDGQLFSDVARYAIEQSQSYYSLQLVQSRLLLGLYYTAIGDSQSGWDFSGQGFRAALGLKLNIEEHCQDIRGDKEEILGLRRYALIECRRRTYWLAYIVDRLGDFHEDRVPMLQGQDTFLRLPCTEMVYSLQGPSNTQFFRKCPQHADGVQQYQPTASGPMACLVDISTVWGDVSTYIYRYSREPLDEDALRYEEHHEGILQRLDEWERSLNKDLAYTSSNASLTIDKGTMGIFFEMHTVYHATKMRLNRNLPDTAISPLLRSRNFVSAREQAHQLLEMMEVVASASRSSKNALDTSGNFPDFSDQYLESCSPLAGSTPFAGYAVLLAIDILSAGGSTDPNLLNPIIQSMTAGLAVVDELSQCWASAAAQKKIILQRLEDISRISTSNVIGTGKFWRCRTPLDTAFKSGQDIYYASGDSAFSSDDFFEQMGAAVDEHDVVFLD